MANVITDFIDLISSGDEQKIKCVLLPTLGGMAGAGIIFSETGPGAGVAAVLGGLASYIAAYNMCGAASTRNSFNIMLNTTSLPKSTVDGYERDLIEGYGLTSEQARYVTKAALTYLKSGGAAPVIQTSQIQRKNGVELLLQHREQV